MNKEKFVFAQLISFLNENKFRHIVDKYQGNRYIKHLKCWNQLLAMMFGLLSNRESLRDLISALNNKVSLKTMVVDYLRHFKLHLNEIDELIKE